ncbi:endoglucanase V-like protein [Russula compacta]|nr:endoglucanase V-like protein [Russula compacta]
MKSTLALVLVVFSTLAAAHTHKSHGRNSGWVQNYEGHASFTAYSGCANPSCGIRMNFGYTAAANELAFGASSGAGDSCGRCFKIKATHDPYTPSYDGSMGNAIVVRVTDLCPVSAPYETSPPWCNQTVSHPHNQYGKSMHFDLCEDSQAPEAFFPGSRRAMVGLYVEVPCSEWQGSEGETLWNGACMAPEDAPSWPEHSCGNRGAKHSLVCIVM